MDEKYLKITAQWVTSHTYREQPMQSGDKEHTSLKSVARELAKLRGFKPDEIYEEVTIETPHVTIRADIIAVNQHKSIAIECGNTPIKRLNQLELFFDEVLWLPYEYIHLPQEHQHIIGENMRLQTENTRLLHKANDLEYRHKELIRNIRTMLPRDQNQQS